MKLKVFREQTEENIYQCHLRDSPVKNTLVNTFRAKIGANTVADVVKLVPLLKQTAVYIQTRFSIPREFILIAACWQNIFLGNHHLAVKIKSNDA